MNPHLSSIIAQSRQQDLLRAAEEARRSGAHQSRTPWSRRFRWTFRTPKTATALSPQVESA
jgi:hypothetical protein